MTNVEALKALYAALGGDAADVADATTITAVLNAIAAKYEGADDATTNAEAITNITAVLDNIIPEPTTDLNAKFGSTPESFTMISNVVEITIPDGVTTIGTKAFNGAKLLTKVNIPQGVTSIGPDAFHSCSGLTEITLPNSVSVIGNQSFMDSGITAIEINNPSTYMGTNIFSGCTKLNTITIHGPEGSIVGAPWGAPHATVVWTG